jgi:hypothetical protein
LKDEASLSSGDSITYLFELSSAYRKYLSLESIELIKADPSSRSCNTSEDVGHGLIVHLIGTVEDIARFGKSISKILSGLSFTCTGRTSWGTTHLHVKSLSGSDVNSISERSDNKSRTITKILITIS